MPLLLGVNRKSLTRASPADRLLLAADMSPVRSPQSAIRNARILLARLRALRSRRRRERDLDEEIAHHLAALADDARAKGASDEAARRAALRTFGGVAQTREAWREQRGFARGIECDDLGVDRDGFGAEVGRFHQLERAALECRDLGRRIRHNPYYL